MTTAKRNIIIINAIIVLCLSCNNNFPQTFTTPLSSPAKRFHLMFLMKKTRPSFHYIYEFVIQNEHSISANRKKIFEVPVQTFYLQFCTQALYSSK